MSRREVTFTVQTDDGPKTVTILDVVTVDDLVVLGLSAYVHEVRLGTEYTSPFSRGIRDALVRVRVAQRS